MVKPTSLNKIKIIKFRALKSVDIELGTQVTVICGKNGTSKSSILGIAAQIFSFDKDYTVNKPIKYKTITGAEFKSKYSEHFRISDRFDLPGSMDVEVEMYDGYTNQNATASLGLSKRDGGVRPVVRKNSTAFGMNESRNFTHPVIYLSLKRLFPIADRDYRTGNYDYLKVNQQVFINLTNELLNRSASTSSSTTGLINSAVAHGTDYDQDSVSAGEDNLGQIVLALMAFRKLKDEYTGYRGGLLLLDEADAGLFPAAQLKLMDMFHRECGQLDLQVVMTSHSPTLIEYAHTLSTTLRKRFKTVYLSDTFGSVQALHDKSWPEISADLHTRTITANRNISLPEVNVYLEDKEAQGFLEVCLRRHPAKKYCKIIEVSLGCSNYIDLAKRKIPEFATRSLICLDGDVSEVQISKLPSIVLLPGRLPPDQLIFEFLYNLPPDDKIWKNTILFTRANLTSIARSIISRLSLVGSSIDLKSAIQEERESVNAKGGKSVRELFKDFYNNAEFQLFLKGPVEFNPWSRWVKDNKDLHQKFIDLFCEKLTQTMTNGHHIDRAKVAQLVKNKVPKKNIAKP
jgi:predicted ATPase